MNPEFRAETMSQIDFAQLGGERLAYIKCVDEDGARHLLVCGADGTELWAVESRELAVAIARRQGLWPLSLH